MRLASFLIGAALALRLVGETPPAAPLKPGAEIQPTNAAAVLGIEIEKPDPRMFRLVISRSNEWAQCWFADQKVHLVVNYTNQGFTRVVETNLVTVERTTIEKAGRPPTVLERQDALVSTNLYFEFHYQGKPFRQLLETTPCTNCPALYREIIVPKG